MRLRRHVLSRTGTAAIGAIALAASVLVGAGAASASPSQQGSLQVRGAGTNYARAYASLAAAKGGTASFSLKVTNTGTTLAQYRVFFWNAQNQPTDGSAKLFLGSTDVSSLAADPAQTYDDPGYVTAPIAAGKTVLLTLKVTLKTTALQTDPLTEYVVALTSLDGNPLNGVAAIVNTKSTTGTGDGDIYVTTAGQAATLAQSSADAPVSRLVVSEALKAGASATFTVKLQNDGSTPGSLSLSTQYTSLLGCGTTITIKQGSADITDTVLTFPGYHTPVLAHGKSVTVTITLKAPTPLPPYNPNPLGCTGLVDPFTLSSGNLQTGSTSSAVIADAFAA